MRLATLMGPRTPCRTMRTARSGEPRTHSESSKGGASPSRPRPLVWWHKAHTAVNRIFPAAKRCCCSSVSGGTAATSARPAFPGQTTIAFSLSSAAASAGSFVRRFQPAGSWVKASGRREPLTPAIIPLSNATTRALPGDSAAVRARRRSIRAVSREAKMPLARPASREFAGTSSGDHAGFAMSRSSNGSSRSPTPLSKASRK